MLVRTTQLVEQLTTKQPALRSLLEGSITTAAVATFSKQELAEFRRRIVASAALPRSSELTLRQG
jgi:hypothetical protein